MKRLFIVLIILFFASVAWGADLRSVGNTTDAAITVGTGYLKKIIVNTDSVNSVTLDVYDHATAASGSKLFSSFLVLSTASNRHEIISFNGQECLYVNGIYVDVTTDGTVAYDVYFESR